MATLDSVLKARYRDADNEKITLTVTTTLGALREYGAALAGLGGVTVTAGESTTGTEKAPRGGAGATNGAGRKRAKGKGKAAKAGKSGRSTSKAAQASPGQKGGTARVKQEDVIAAIHAGHTTPAAIATKVNSSQRQVSKALSRYVKQGLIQRVNTGEYAPLSASSEA